MIKGTKRIFLSYAHEDRSLAARVAEELRQNFPNFESEVWWDAAIQPGEPWNQRIHVQLVQADLVVLLVSGEFGNSIFIQSQEFPITLDRIRAHKSHLLWVAVDAAGDAWADAHQLSALQAAGQRQRIGELDGRYLATALAQIRSDAMRLLDLDGYNLQQSLNPKYELKTRLGGGRSWQIYVATDHNLKRDVAVYCPADAEQREKVGETVVAATANAGPSIAMIYGARLDAKPTPHVISQYANRGTLAERIAQTREQTGGGLPCEETRELILHLARALSVDARSKLEPHELRPSKVLIDDAAGFLISPFSRWRWRFGRQLRTHLADSCVAAEERAYVAPELLAGPPKELDRVYQYLLGLLAWHAIVGELPRAHDGVDQFPSLERLPSFVEHLPSPNAVVPRCSPWLAELVVAMTAREPENRVASLDEVVRRLSAAPAEDLGLVRVSYERCLQSEGGADAFFDQVYRRLRELLPPEEWRKFGEKVNWHAQRANLAEAVALLLAFHALDSTRHEPTSLSRIARQHGKGGYSVSAESFPRFQRALVETVVDTLKPGAEDRELLRSAWNRVLRDGIEYLSKRVER